MSVPASGTYPRGGFGSNEEIVLRALRELGGRAVAADVARRTTWMHARRAAGHLQRLLRQGRVTYRWEGRSRVWYVTRGRA